MLASIIITCYNRQEFIGRAIRSAIDQRFPYGRFEVIVVDDGSTDNSRAIIDDFGDAVVPIFHERNMGLPAARNSGIRKAKGRYVIHLDSDDYINEDLLGVEYLFLNHNNSWGAVACDYMLVDEHENHVERKSALESPIACGIMFRKDYLINIGLYDEKMLLCEEEELRKRFEARYSIHHIPLPLYRYIRHSDNITNDHEKLKKYKKKVHGA